MGTLLVVVKKNSRINKNHIKLSGWVLLKKSRTLSPACKITKRTIKEYQISSFCSSSWTCNVHRCDKYKIEDVKYIVYKSHPQWCVETLVFPLLENQSKSILKCVD
jgi:hypothetical protein